MPGYQNDDDDNGDNYEEAKDADRLTIFSEHVDGHN